MPGYHVENFGCRATQADGAALEHQLEAHGLARAASQRQAELVVLNTCTVTAAADQDARAAIRRVQRQNPTARIVVTGCYAQRAPEEIAALPGVTCVIGNSHKHQLAEIALSHFGSRIYRDSQDEDSHQHGREGYDFNRTEKARPDAALAAEVHDTRATTRLGQTPLPAENLIPASVLTENWQPRTNSIYVSDIFAHTELLAAPVFEAANQRTRPNLKIQDGCDNRCSFCVIPYVRGQSRSLQLSEIIREVNTLIDAGYRELVISGINLGRWGYDLASNRHSENDERPTTNDRRLELLIETILRETSLEKLRISSVEPMDWSDELIALVAQSPRIAKHAHVPLQSGSDAILRRMHRKYRPWHYREKIEKIRAAMPTAAIGADVMVGFPAETEAEFEATRSFIEGLPFTYLHVFTYSARPGTPAAEMPHQVPVQLARERNKILRDLAEEKKQSFMRSFVGKTVEAITLGSSDLTSHTEALTDNYLKLNLEGRHDSNRWLNVRVEGLVDGALAGFIDIA